MNILNQYDLGPVETQRKYEQMNLLGIFSGVPTEILKENFLYYQDIPTHWHAYSELIYPVIESK